MAFPRREFLRSLAAYGAAFCLGAVPPSRVGQMTKRRIPRTGEEIPVIGMGTWQTFDPPNPAPAALDQLADVLQIFMSAGGSVIDFVSDVRPG